MGEWHTFRGFLSELSTRIGATLPPAWREMEDVGLAQRFLELLNAFLYQTYTGIGTTDFDGEEFHYFSDFHRFWEAHHAEIINPRPNPTQARTAASALAAAVDEYGSQILEVTQDTAGLASEALAQVRFFSANQDFRRPPQKQFERYLRDPGRFDADVIAGDPADFLSFMGLTGLSQTDKRMDYARNAAQFLLTQRTKAYGLAHMMDSDAAAIREALVTQPNMGYGMKKANMFLRDMYVWDVWPQLKNLEEIDVASDRNTMKVALRTRVLRTDIPLLSSLLDIFCHQYEFIDAASAQAWRAVWAAWRELHASTAPASPCMMDFLLYRIGSEYCRHNVVRYRCERGHTFYHFGARLQLCRVCRTEKVRSRANPEERILPCQVHPSELPREDGRLLLKPGKLLYQFDGRCVFDDVCQPRSDSFRAFDPPRSISIKGQTGWTSAYADKDRGGGGLMA